MNSNFLRKPWPNGDAWTDRFATNSRKSSQSGCRRRGVPSAQLHGHPDRYKIKLRAIGYRLVYEVHDYRLVVLVVSVGKRERNAVYKAAAQR